MKHTAKAAIFASVNAAKQYWLCPASAMPKGIWFLKPVNLKIAADVCNVK
jgi:hypothetical protein